MRAWRVGVLTCIAVGAACGGDAVVQLAPSDPSDAGPLVDASAGTDATAIEDGRTLPTDGASGGDASLDAALDSGGSGDAAAPDAAIDPDGSSADASTPDASTPDAAPDGSVPEPTSLTPVWQKEFRRSTNRFGEQVRVASVARQLGDELVIGADCSLVDGGGQCTSTGFVLEGVTKPGLLFVAAYTGAGAALWDHVWAPTSANGALVAVDLGGNVYVTTSFRGTIDFGGGPRTATLTSLAVASFDANGAYRWDRVYQPASGNVLVTSIAAGPVDHVVVGGKKSGVVDLGTGAHNGQTGFVVSLGAGGSDGWVKLFHPSGTFNALESRASGLAVDAAGQVTVAGEFRGSMDLGGGPRAGATSGEATGFFASFASSGAHVWDRVVGVRACAVATDGTDTIGVYRLDHTVRHSAAGTALWDFNDGPTPSAGLQFTDGAFAVSPSFDEIWSTGVARTTTITRRRKSDGASVVTLDAFATNFFYATSATVLAGGDPVVAGRYGGAGGAGGPGYLARFAHP